MREVAPGDLVFSFASTRIAAIGIARSPPYSSPKPAEFGSAGPNWSDIGWRVDVWYKFLDGVVRPVDHMDRIAPVLPKLYSPLSATGQGYQGIYLTRLSPVLAHTLIEIIGDEARDLSRLVGDHKGDGNRDVAVGLVEWEEHERDTVSADRSIDDTQRSAVILARRGQGKFKESVMAIENQCRVTGVSRLEHLRASHIKPWRDCQTYDERLDGENGFLMTPTVDHLFDRGFISFEDNGRLIVSPVAHEDSMNRMGVDMCALPSVGKFTSAQRNYLEYHRDQVFLESKLRR